MASSPARSGPIPPGGGIGVVDDTVVELTDVAETITDIAGAPRLAGSRGRSLVPRVRGDTGSVRDFAYSRIQSYAALRTERFRFTMESRSGVPCELFDMQEDPNERVNLVNDSSRRGIVSELKHELSALQGA